jgi:hypothetical protein
MSAAPNPFSTSTALRFGPAIEDGESVRIFDAGGRKVATLEATEGRASWNGRDRHGHLLPSGVYFARLAEVSLPVVVRR